MLLSFRNYLRYLYIGFALASLSSAHAEEHDLTLNNAAFHGDADAVHSFLANGADVHERDGSGWMPLHNAVYGGNMDVPQVLLDAGANVDALTLSGLSALQLAVGYSCEEAFKHFDEHETILEKFLNDGEKQSSWKAAFCTKVEASKEATVRALIGAGATVNAAYGESKVTPLLLAARRGASNLVRILIEEGEADVDARCFYEGFYDATALLAAVKGGHVETAQMLIDYDAKINTTDDIGKTILHAAVVMGELDTVRMLVALGADQDIEDLYGHTPATLAEILATSSRPDIFPRERYKPIAEYFQSIEHGE